MSKQLLIRQIQKKALFRGKFTLTSGQESDYYIDLSKILFSDDLETVCDLILDEVNFSKINAIGGPAMGSLPIICGLQVFLGFMDRSFFTRKEAKEHGRQDLIEGNLQKGDEVLLFEDIVTTGNSLLDCAKVVQTYGAKVREVIAILDRNQGAKELFAQNGLQFRSLINIDEILNK